MSKMIIFHILTAYNFMSFFAFKSRLLAQHGTQTHDPKIKSRTLYR